MRNIFIALRRAFGLLGKNDPLMLSGATAFFTTFAISPIIIILMNALTLYFERENIRPQLFLKIESVFGQQAAQDIQSIVDNIRTLESNLWITIMSSVFFIFIATTLLSVVRNAIHRIWNIDRTINKKFLSGLRQRLISITMILLMGVLFLIALVMDTSIAMFRDYLDELIPGVHVALIRVLNIIFSIAVVTAWFTLVFKMLPEAQIKWRVALAGGLLTGILFSLGKFVLGKILIYGRVAAIFGASTSIALLLLFIFYSSLILYFGTAFTFEYGNVLRRHILPRGGKAV